MFKKLMGWVIGFTSIGKKANAFLDGKKQMLASLAAALAATATIIAKLAEQGTSYLVTIASTPEFSAASVGWIGFFNALGRKKLNEKLEAV